MPPRPARAVLLAAPRATPAHGQVEARRADRACGARRSAAAPPCSTSGMFEPWPLTIRMRSKPWWHERAALVEQATRRRRSSAASPSRGSRGGAACSRAPGVGNSSAFARPAALNALDGAARDRLDQPHVGVDRQVVAVVLERRRRDHGDDVVARGQLAQLEPRVLAVATRGYARMSRPRLRRRAATSQQAVPWPVSAPIRRARGRRSGSGRRPSGSAGGSGSRAARATASGSSPASIVGAARRARVAATAPPTAAPACTGAAGRRSPARPCPARRCGRGT